MCEIVKIDLKNVMLLLRLLDSPVKERASNETVPEKYFSLQECIARSQKKSQKTKINSQFNSKAHNFIRIMK